MGDPAKKECLLRVEDMERVLDLYEEPYDPNRPVVCFDERSCQLIGDVRDPLPTKPGQVERFDSEYERGGECSGFS